MMLRIKLLKCEKMTFKDKVMYKCIGILNGVGLNNEIIQHYSMNELPTGVELECVLTVKDMKEVKFRITSNVVDSADKKGIFNR